MNYRFKGQLWGRLCADCIEPLADVVVRLYRASPDASITARAVAATKDTLALLNDREVQAKSGALLGEFRTDAQGNFTAELGDQHNYQGEAFEVDVQCSRPPGFVPRAGEPEPEALQFAVTVVQPQWRKGPDGLVAAWQECLAARFWCWLRARLGAWVICGRVRVCDTGAPVAGVKVSAFDRDWLQDDPLGSAFTDGSGHFRIDYQAADFRKDILGWNLELVGGPDVYFHVDLPSGTSLLAEPSSRGRDPDRENVGPCFCVDLCVKDAPVVTHAWFTSVGDFNIYSDINHLGDGRTTHAVPFGFPGAHGGPGYGFTGGLKLMGDCPTTYPTGGPALRYRFLWEVIGSGAGLKAVTAGQLLAVKVGTRPIVWNVSGTPAPVVTAQDIYVCPFGAPPGQVAPPTPAPALPMNVPWGPIPPAIMVPDADGWVPVDPSTTNAGLSGPLLKVDSNSIVPGGAAPGNGAGNAVATPKDGALVHLVFQAEPVLGASASYPTLSNELERVLINNWSTVNLLNLAQFAGPGATPCSKLSNALDIMYTADHQLMADWSLAISTSATVPPPGIPALPSGNVPRGAAGTFHIDTTTWPACSYTVTLTTRAMLTDGETDDSHHPNSLTFCKN